MAEQSIDKCAIGVAGSRVHNHAARLIYYDYIRILINNNERDVLF
jgi:hypothetical protein